MLNHAKTHGPKLGSISSNRGSLASSYTALDGICIKMAAPHIFLSVFMRTCAQPLHRGTCSLSFFSESIQIFQYTREH